MTDQFTTSKPAKPRKQDGEKGTPLSRMSLLEVDSGLAECDKVIKAHSETVKSKLAANGSIPTNVLRELSRSNAKKGRLIMRRVALLIESGDGAALELIEKLMKLRLTKSA